jgi:hypothetical protein
MPPAPSPSSTTQSFFSSGIAGNLDDEAYRTTRPGAPGAKPGQILEVPFMKLPARALALACAASLLTYWLNVKLFASTPESRTPEFRAKAAQVGPVAERTAAPPVFLNPMRNRCVWGEGVEGLKVVCRESCWDGLVQYCFW